MGTGINQHSGDVFLANMSYDGQKPAVTITDTVTNKSASQSYPIDIPQVVGNSTAYVGFTAGTGFYTATQEILNWTFLTQVGRGNGAVEELPRLATDELQEYLRAAAFLARCVALSAQDTKLPEARRQALGQTYARRGVEVLRRAYDRELLLDAHDLLRHDFDPLREREDFQQLQDDLKSRAEIRTGGLLVRGLRLAARSSAVPAADRPFPRRKAPSLSSDAS